MEAPRSTAIRLSGTPGWTGVIGGIGAPPLFRRRLFARFQSHVRLRNRIRLRAELNMALLASLHGDLMPHVFGGRGLAPYRLLDGVLSLTPAWNGPSGQHLGVVLGLGGV